MNYIWSASDYVPLLHLNYIAHYRPHLRCCYYFASHKKICYFSSSGLTNSKKLSFTFFLIYSHKGWTSALVCSLLSTTPSTVPVNCTSATSYNCDVTIAFFIITHNEQQVTHKLLIFLFRLLTSLNLLYN